MYKPVTWEEADILAKAGVTIYRKGVDGMYKSRAWRLFSEGRYDLSDIGATIRQDLFVKVEIHEQCI
jgi:hypothetical protein